MKLLFVTPYPLAPANDGGRRRILEIARGLNEKADITAVCAAPTIGELPDMPFPVHTYAREGFPFQVISPSMVYKLGRLLSSDRFDAIWLEQIWSGAIVALARLHRRIPIYLDAPDVVSDLPEQVPSPFRPLIGPYERFVMRLAYCIFVVSELDQSKLRNRGIPAEKIQVLPNGVDTSEFRPDPDGRERVRGRLSLEADEHLLLFFGQLSYFPNRDALNVLVDQIVPRLRPRYRLAVVGRGIGERERMRLEAFSNVTITGAVDSIADYINAADVVLVPLRFGTGTRLKILESIACGVPVVTTSIGAEGLDRGILGPGLSVVDDWKDWPSTIVSAASRPHLPPSRTFVETYDWRFILDRLRLP